MKNWEFKSYYSENTNINCKNKLRTDDQENYYSIKFLI